MSSEPAIRARHVSKAYKLGLTGRKDSLLKILERRLRHPIRGRRERPELFRALDDVSFDVAEGEAVGVIGRNGAGKSTLLKILSRITPPSDGVIDMQGNVGSLLEVGTGFHPELTGLENVYLNGTILGMSKSEIDRRLEEIIAFAEVGKFLDTPVKRYSSGMRVRLAFSVAAHLDPEVLIVDEVLSVGDAAFQAKCLTKMRSVVSDQGRTVLYVSHNLVTLEHLCPRSLLLANGQMIFDGPTADAVSQYMALFPHGERSDIPGVFDLDAADRSGGTFERIFHQLALRPGGGLPSDSVRMGDRLRMELAVGGLDELPDDASVVVAISSNVDQDLIVMSSSMLPLTALHDRCSRETIILDIPSLPLTPGEYRVTVRVSTGGRNLDLVRSAAEFTVEPADVLGTGFRYAAINQGRFVVPWEWELRPAGDVPEWERLTAGSPPAAG
jgi:lipopolysaccharide transport system ATP-binding protein